MQKVTAGATGWLPAADELAAYEGIRLGDERAFVALAAPLHATLHGLARLYVRDDTRTGEVVRRSWQVALRAHEMFRWQTPLATWVAGFTVATGRTAATRVLPATGWPPGTGPSPARPVAAGPTDWADLPWSPRWAGVGQALTLAVEALPIDEREVVHGHDVEGWPDQRVRDVFGLTEAAASRHLDAARGHLHEATARYVGQVAGDVHRADQIAALTRWLGERRRPGAAALDEATLDVFHRWATGRRRRWTWLGRRVLGLSPPAAGPAGRRGGPASATVPVPPRPT